MLRESTIRSCPKWKLFCLLVLPNILLKGKGLYFAQISWDRGHALLKTIFIEDRGHLRFFETFWSFSYPYLLFKCSSVGFEVLIWFMKLVSLHRQDLTSTLCNSQITFLTCAAITETPNFHFAWYSFTIQLCKYAFYKTCERLRNDYCHVCDQLFLLSDLL